MWASSALVKDNRFASMDQRDAETGNDPTLFRSYNPRLYRWLSPDPLAGDISNPQSLNRYAYVLNNPTNLTDPLGLSCSNPEDPIPCLVAINPSVIDIVGFINAGGGVRGGGFTNGGSPGGSGHPMHAPLLDTGTGSGPGGGGSGAHGESTVQKVKKAVCSALPEGRTVGVSGGIGGIGGQTGSLELVVNYNTGQVSGFVSGGFQAGWNGVAQASASTGFIYGDLMADNSGYKGGDRHRTQRRREFPDL